MKILSKIKEHLKKKNLRNDINRDFEELEHKIDEREETEYRKEISLNIDTSENIHELDDVFFNKSWTDDITFNNKNREPNSSGQRSKVFKNLTKKLKILRKDKLQLEEVKVS